MPQDDPRTRWNRLQARKRWERLQQAEPEEPDTSILGAPGRAVRGLVDFAKHPVEGVKGIAQSVGDAAETAMYGLDKLSPIPRAWPARRTTEPTAKERAIAVGQIASIPLGGAAARAVGALPATLGAGALWMPDDPVAGALTGGILHGAAKVPGAVTRRLGPSFEGALEKAAADVGREAKGVPPMFDGVTTGKARRPASEATIPRPRLMPRTSDPVSASFVPDVALDVAKAVPEVKAHLSPYQALLDQIDAARVQPRTEPFPTHPERLSERGSYTAAGVDAPGLEASSRGAVDLKRVGRRVGQPLPPPPDLIEPAVKPLKDLLAAAEGSVTPPRAEPFPAGPAIERPVSIGGIDVPGLRASSRGPLIQKSGAQRRIGEMPEPGEVPTPSPTYAEKMAAQHEKTVRPPVVEPPAPPPVAPPAPPGINAPVAAEPAGLNARPVEPPAPPVVPPPKPQLFRPPAGADLNVPPVRPEPFPAYPEGASFGGKGEPMGADVRPTRGKGRFGPPLFDEAREPGGKLRAIERVSDDGLIRELREYETKMNDANERAQYRTAITDYGDAIQVSTGRGAASTQAKAIQNLRDYRRITAAMEGELKKRGWTQDDIWRRRSELEALEEAKARDLNDVLDERGLAGIDDSFDFGENLTRTREPAGTAPERVAREPATDLTLSWKAYGGKDSPLGRHVEDVMNENAAALRAEKGFESLSSQDARAKAFAAKLVDGAENLDPAKLQKLDGAQVVGMYRVVEHNSAAMEATARALNEGNLTAAEIKQAHQIIDRASEQNATLLKSIVREKAEFARSLGFQRTLVHRSLDPNVWLVQAQRLAGEKRIPDTVMLEIRKLANEAKVACGVP